MTVLAVGSRWPRVSRAQFRPAVMGELGGRAGIFPALAFSGVALSPYKG